MSRLTLLITLMLSSIALNGQNINVTFTGTGAATQIDSVTATNLKTNQSVTLPGNETLILTVNTGIPSVSELTTMGVVFPNPFSGRATFSMIIPKVQTVYLKVQNLVGQVVAETKALVQPGENEFALTVNTAGIYIVSLTSEKGTSSYKVICTDATETDNRIQFYGMIPGFHKNPLDLKSFQTGFSLGCAIGDIILYRCKSGIYTTILTDSPASSKNYDVEFVACMDLDGKDYSVVKIGDQFWMAENLAYLPAVSPSSVVSDTDPYSYVYGYGGNTVASAKGTANYSTYGALYNWEAAKTACPSGWHLPTDPEWTTLTDYLTNNGYGYGGSGSDIGKSMASTSGWTPYSSAGTIGNDQGSNNRSGFTALPGGGRLDGGGFSGLGDGAAFWSSSEKGAYAWSRVLNSDGDDLYPLLTARYNGFSVRCLKGSAGLPSLTTSDISNITQISALGGGEVINDGGSIITERGVCWNTTGTPTTSNNKSTNGTGTGAFTSSLTELTAGTQYYVRAYATNSAGTGYGDQKQFTTSGGGGDTFTDTREGHVYKKVTIGTQTWMAENLAYLPAVSPSSVGSDTDPYYYVYGYEGSTVSAAMATANFGTYGVLYNWPAALTACPSGWHLPTDPEWTTLTDYLTNNGYGYRGSGSDIGKSMASTSGWTPYSSAGTIGNDQGSNNRSGFTALPGGGRGYDGGFGDLGDYPYFWSASGFDASHAWGRGLGYDSEYVGRDNGSRSCGFSVRCLQNK